MQPSLFWFVEIQGEGPRGMGSRPHQKWGMGSRVQIPPEMRNRVQIPPEIQNRAQLFERRLVINPGLKLTQVPFSCVQKHFLG